MIRRVLQKWASGAGVEPATRDSRHGEATVFEKPNSLPLPARPTLIPYAARDCAGCFTALPLSYPDDGRGDFCRLAKIDSR